MQIPKKESIPYKNKAKEQKILGFILFILLFCNTGDINAESVRTAGTANVVLAELLRQPQHILAFGTAAVNVRFSVAYAVALKTEKSCDLLYETQKISVFLPSFIRVTSFFSRIG